MLTTLPSLVQSEEIYLHLVLEYLPETVYRITRSYTKAKQHMPMIYVKVCHATSRATRHAYLTAVASSTAISCAALRIIPLTVSPPRSYTHTSYTARWRTSTARGSATETSNRRIS
jgi:hypothetical protein